MVVLGDFQSMVNDHSPMLSTSLFLILPSFESYEWYPKDEYAKHASTSSSPHLEICRNVTLLKSTCIKPTPPATCQHFKPHRSLQTIPYSSGAFSVYIEFSVVSSKFSNLWRSIASTTDLGPAIEYKVPSICIHKHPTLYPQALF